MEHSTQVSLVPRLIELSAVALVEFLRYLFIEQPTFIDEDEEYRDEEEARLQAENDARRSKELEDLWRARLLTDVASVWPNS